GAILEKLDGKFEVTQIDVDTISVDFEVNKGITENDPRHYFVQFGNFTGSFFDLDITIKPPKAANKYKQAGNVDDFLNKELSIFNDDE
ncbi:2878_t:CDS:1, partial [Gigaspora rosea]